VKHILTKFDAHTRLEAIRHAERALPQKSRIPPTVVGGWFNYYLCAEHWLLQIPPTVVGGLFNSYLGFPAVMKLPPTTVGGIHQLFIRTGVGCN
jgi:hypothetical protein